MATSSTNRARRTTPVVSVLKPLSDETFVPLFCFCIELTSRQRYGRRILHRELLKLPPRLWITHKTPLHRRVAKDDRFLSRVFLNSACVQHTRARIHHKLHTE